MCQVIPALWEQPQARRLPAPLPYFYWLVPPCQGSFDPVSATQCHPIKKHALLIHARQICMHVRTHNSQPGYCIGDACSTKCLQHLSVHNRAPQSPINKWVKLLTVLICVRNLCRCVYVRLVSPGETMAAGYL